jgi:cysteine desulfurase
MLIFVSKERMTMERDIYLDNSATTRPYDEVIDYINYINASVYGNPSSLHTKGIEAERLIKKARDIIAGSLGVEGREVYFTSGGTESNNLAIIGYLSANPRKGRHVITSKIEHPSVLETCRHLAENGYRVDYLDVDSKGIINLEQLRDAINEDTALISIMVVNNEIGSVQPVEEIVKIKNAVNRNTVLHMDAIQAYGKIKLNPKKLGIDLLSISSHKIHGPKGVGAVWANKTIRLKPILFGGGQESLIRSGTENVSGIGGFGMASEMIFQRLEENFKKVAGLKSLFLKRLEEEIDDFHVNSPEDASPYILNISFPDLKAEVLLHHLEEKGIYVSTGSACSSRKDTRSHVLQAINVDKCYAEGAIRFSFSSLNTEQDVLDTIDALKVIIPKIKIHKNRRR